MKVFISSLAAFLFTLKDKDIVNRPVIMITMLSNRQTPWTLTRVAQSSTPYLAPLNLSTIWVDTSSGPE